MSGESGQGAGAPAGGKPQANLKRQIASGSFWVLLGTGGQQLINFLVFIAIARVLDPGIVGVVAFAVIGIDVTSYICKFGQVETLQRDQAHSQARLSTAFWLTATLGLVATIGFEIAAQVLGHWPKNHLVAQVMTLLAPLCLLQGANATAEAVLRGRMEFRSLTLRGWIATILGGGVAVAMSIWHPGVYVLVAQRLVTALAQTGVLWAMIGWRPSLKVSRAEGRSLVSSGWRIMIANLSGIVNARIADGITGAFLGASDLGLLRLAWRFYDLGAQIVVTPISSVALSSFSRLREDLEALRRAYLRMTQLLGLVAFPAFFGLGAVAHTFIQVIVGPKWAGAAPLLQMVALIILTGGVNYFFAPTMIAVGRSDIMMRQSLVQLVMTSVFVLFGVQFGLRGVMAAHIAWSGVIATYNMIALRAHAGIAPRRIFAALAPPAVACAVMWLAVRGLEPILTLATQRAHIPLIVALVGLVGAGALTYVGTLLVGDVAGLWRGYVKSTVGSVRGILGRPAATPTQAGQPA